MKNAILLAVMSVFVLSGCAERRFHTLTYDKSYDYDRLYQSALMSMNSNNFTPVSYDKSEGVIYARDFSTLYSAASIGIFGILPWFYTELNNPTISLVFLKNSDTTVISVNETNSSMNVPYLFRIKYGIDQWYKMNEKREITKTKTIIENPDREKLKASVSIIKALSGHFVSIKNDSRFRWNNVLVGIQYMGENYVVSVKEISQGKPVDINLSTFSSGTNFLPAKYMPEKIELSTDEGIYVWGTGAYKDKTLPGE